MIENAIATVQKLVLDYAQVPVCFAIAKTPLLSAQLSADELTVFSKWNHPKRQQHWLMGRNALKQVLQQLGYSQETSSIQFPHPQFSLTHCETMAIAAGVADINTVTGLGVDYEAFREIKNGALKFYLSPVEQQLLTQVDSPDIRIKLWTIKEALFKADIQNDTTSYVDYELTDLSADNGIIRCLKTGAVSHYFSVPFDSGYLTIAVGLFK